MAINSVNGDTLLQSGMFPPCRVATSAAITLSGLQTIDSVPLNAGDRVLVNNQANTTQNGIYAASSGNWVRTTDAQSNIQLFQGMTVMVALGTAHGLTLYELSSASDPIVIGTSAIQFQAISAPTPSVGSLFYTAPYAGAVAQTQAAYNAQRVSVRDFGADPTGAADATSAFQFALTAAALLGKQCLAPAGSYRIAGTINIGGNGTCLIGEGVNSTILFSPNAANAIIAVGNGLAGIHLSGFQLNRTVPATAGGDGIQWAIQWISDGFLDNIWARNQYVGFHLGPTSLSYHNNLRAEGCVTHGTLQTNNAAWGGNQWTGSNYYGGNNGIDGYCIASDAGAVQGMGTGNMTNIYGFANGRHGLSAIGTAASPINALRLFQFFFGQDNASEIFIDSHGGGHQLANGFVELAGTSNVGPTSSVPPSGVGHGIEITVNNYDVMINGVQVNGMSQSGIVASATGFTSINGCFLTNNDDYGVVISDGTKAVLTSNWFIGNGIAEVFVTLNGSSLQALGNTPSSVNGGPGIMTTNTAQNVTGVKTFLSGTFLLAGGTSGQLSIQPDLVASGSWTIPAGVDRFVGNALAATLTNKAINAANNTITNITTAMFAANVVDTDPTLAAASATRIPSQSAIKSYVDNGLTGLFWKPAVAVATTANITLSGEQTIDGVLTSASRVLVKNQGTGSQNGIYVSAAGAWARAADMDLAAEFPSATVFVEAGTVGSDTAWTCTNNAVTIGVTAVVFAQVMGAGTFSAGSGLQLIGNQFSVLNLTTAMFAANVVDTDATLAAASATRVPAQSAVKSYVDAAVAPMGAIEFKATGINFNSGNTDTAIPIVLPAGVTRYAIQAIRIAKASASLTTATCGVFTAVAAGGTAVVASGSAITVSTAAANTLNNMQLLTSTISNSLQASDYATLYFRVQNPQGSAATGDVTITIFPLS